MVQEDDFMSIRLVIDGNAVYEIDEDCEVCRRNKEKEEERQIQRTQEGNTGKKQKMCIRDSHISDSAGV